MGETIPVEGLLGSRAGFLLSYPRYDEGEAGRRIAELQGLGIEALELRGPGVITGVHVLGKGHVGVVVAALLSGRRVALKVRRVDADRESLADEASKLRIANGVSVGPRLLGWSPNFLAMELVEGEYLFDWVGGLGPSDGGRLRHALRMLLEAARRLDGVGLDHGELSRADRHVIVQGDEPRIVDFESASASRRCGNVTSVVHYLFFNGRMRAAVGRVLPLPDGDRLRRVLGLYRRAPTEGGFGLVFEACGLAAQGF